VVKGIRLSREKKELGSVSSRGERYYVDSLGVGGNEKIYKGGQVESSATFSVGKRRVPRRAIQGQSPSLIRGSNKNNRETS